MDPKPSVVTSTPTTAAAVPLWRRIVTVAWLAILLGFAIEALLLFAAAWRGRLGAAAPFLADLAQKVSWSFLVCVGLGFGSAASKARPAATGAAGLLAAPLGFVVARALYRGASAALGLAGAAAADPSPWLVAALKAAQYGVFGWLLGWLGRRPAAGLGAHAAIGAATGLLFGGIDLWLFAAAGALPPPAVLPRAIDELLFPVGCALVLWVADALGRRAG
jgi:hypothetical protein